MPIQRASYRGVRFDVISVDDELNRATIDHAYPFVNGADVEDLGLNPLTVRMQAVFYGEGYYTNFKTFLSVLQKQGADVLVHPIRGRLPNMLCTSANFRHDAEMIDYVALDLTFVESTPAKPIFVFNSAFLSQIDSLLNQLDDFVDDALALYAEYAEMVVMGINAKSRLLSAFGGLFGCFEQVRQLFDFDKVKYALSPATTKAQFKSQSYQAVKQLLEMVELGLNGVASRQDLTTKAKFDEVVRSVKQVTDIPTDLVTGKNIKSAQEVRLKSLTSSLTLADVEVVHLLMQLGCSFAIVKIATDLIADDELLPHEVDYIATKVRLQILQNLQLLRSLTQKEQANIAINLTAPNTGVYTATHQVAEQLRHLAHHFTQLAISAINRKPPLTVRPAPFNGTIQQMAHAFYADFLRANELLRLNPQVRYPNFITQGELLNSYVK